MTRRALLILILALCSLFAGCGEQEQPQQDSAVQDSGLRIAAWNLQWFPGKTPSGTPEEQAEHVSAVISELKAIDADIQIRHGDPFFTDHLHHAEFVRCQRLCCW